MSPSPSLSLSVCFNPIQIGRGTHIDSLTDRKSDMVASVLFPSFSVFINSLVALWEKNQECRNLFFILIYSSDVSVALYLVSGVLLQYSQWVTGTTTL